VHFFLTFVQKEPSWWHYFRKAHCGRGSFEPWDISFEGHSVEDGYVIPVCKNKLGGSVHLCKFSNCESSVTWQLAGPPQVLDMSNCKCTNHYEYAIFISYNYFNFTIIIVADYL
jgi:hypothetical protein